MGNWCFAKCSACFASSANENINPKDIVADWTQKDETAPWFNLDGYEGFCHVLEIYDADTITISIVFCNNFFRTKCRLLGIDAAEIRTKNLKEKEHGIAGKEYLKGLIGGKFIWCRLHKNDKYGRPLGIFYLTEEDFNHKRNSVNDDLIEKGFAYVYLGAKKTLFEDWKKD